MCLFVYICVCVCVHMPVNCVGVTACESGWFEWVFWIVLWRVLFLLLGFCGGVCFG